MKIWVVVDVDNNEPIKAFYGVDAEEKASDFADDYYFSTGNDCVYRKINLEG